MDITQQQRDNLSKALGLFIEGMRAYVVSLLQHKAGDKWPALFADALRQDHKDIWNMRLKDGSQPEVLIDYPHFKGFSLKYKDLMKDDFGKDTNKMPTWFDTITETRNKSAHFQGITADEFTGTFIVMKSIAKSMGMTELETELANLQEAKQVVHAHVAANPQAALEPWFRAVIPHMDIRQGRLDESVFAANLAEVALNQGREIYNNPVVFFSKTFFTAGLKSVAKKVISGLNGTEDAENRVISLQTGFGGGKTHTLISLFHYCKLGNQAGKSAYTRELLEYTGLPQFETANIAVFTNTTNDPANGRVTADGIHIQTIWGELAYQLGGAQTYDFVRKNDEQLIAPGGLFKKVLEQCKPALILVDELADYCVKASARKAGSSSLADQTISFIQELTEAIAGTNNCVAVITLPASPQEVGNTDEAQGILSSLQRRVSRVGADTQPVADDEIYEVIRRRLFEDIGSPEMIEAVASKYLHLYQSSSTELPSNASKMEYKKRLLKSYPFHPELIDIFRVRWASHHAFQRTRGALRLLAAIVSDLYKRQLSLPGPNLLIHSGDINFANLDAISGQLKMLYGNGYDAVITADVAGSSSNAFKIDSDKNEYKQWHLTESIATVILMNSFGSEGSNRGISVPEIKLHLLVPGGFNHNSVNGALDELEDNAHFLYYAQSGSGKRYWFHTKPNINILINQARADIKQEDIEAEVIRKLKEKENGIQLFKALFDPSLDIPEQMKLTLLILNPRFMASGNSLRNDAQAIIEKIATKKGNSERIFRNTLLFLLCSEVGASKLYSDIRDALACKKIYSEYQAQLENDQKQEVKKRIDEAEKQVASSLATAYSVIAKHTVKNGVEILTIKYFKDSFENQVNNNVIDALKEEEWLLDSIGLNTLRNNNLLPTVDHPVR
ncbi:MAG TPA: DUF499 domain-containing protein, partial [Mucilaginibacter sp.]|nr:DUF499 domain-containing protein [Mucilaginibacter sp.]